ncbi:MAG: hypothetical protein Q9192_006538 [Flavoplaca navasiana]
MHPSEEAANNVLYILRLVVEGDDSANRPLSRENTCFQGTKQERQVESLIAVLQYAQAEAAEWQLNHVKLWEPTPWVQDVIGKSNISHRIVEREEDSVASCLWMQVSYRNLSRELKVHSNVAKRLLFQFHKQQNAKKPGSIHAVYVITGYTRLVAPPTSSQNGTMMDGEDAHMQSSPFMSSSMPQPEEEEEQVANIQLLSECNRVVTAKFAAEDPLQAGRQYGTIQNPRVQVRHHSLHSKESRIVNSVPNVFYLQRRKGPRPIPAQPASTASRAIAGPKASTPTVKMESKPESARETKAPPGKATDSSQAKTKDEVPQQSSQLKKPATKTPGLKREQSDIFKSFAKPPNKLSRENTGSSAGASPAPKAETPAPEEIPNAPQDESMDDASDGEQLEDSIISAEKAARSKRATRSEREDQLKKLLDEDGDEGTGTSETDHVSQKEDPTTIEAPMKRDEHEPVTSTAATTTTSSGRRRGRRKVVKKKTIKDDEGYLGTSHLPESCFTIWEKANLRRTAVTKEEPGWESFSEDEPTPRQATPVSSAPSNLKGKKTAGKPGQGNIMSFFGKR